MKKKEVISRKEEKEKMMATREISEI